VHYDRPSALITTASSRIRPELPSPVELTAHPQPAPPVPRTRGANSAFLAAAGIPTVLYGPEGEGAHADIEWVSRSGTSTATTVLTQFAQNFCS
jgi:acetylornithine deacetylase/succinyl-diaminopimelate desuccinylase-like protein